MSIQARYRQAQARRMTEYRRQSKQKGIKRIELRLDTDTITMLDDMVEQESMTRASYINTLIDEDYSRYRKQ